MRMHLLASVRESSFVVDTGPLIIHAFGQFNEGRHLSDVAADIPPADIVKVSVMLGHMFDSSSFLATTPQVLAEFQNIAQTRAGLDSEGVRRLLQSYLLALQSIGEEYVTKDELLEFKRSRNTWMVCLTDTSLLVASKRRNAVLLTCDRELRRRGESLGVNVQHVYHDVYLAQP